MLRNRTGRFAESSPEGGNAQGFGMKIYDYHGKKNICGARIKQARQERHISQAQLAAKMQIAGITIERDSVSRIEIGTRFVADYELMALSQILDVSVEWLLGTDRSSDRKKKK